MICGRERVEKRFQPKFGGRIAHISEHRKFGNMQKVLRLHAAVNGAGRISDPIRLGAEELHFFQTMLEEVQQPLARSGEVLSQNHDPPNLRIPQQIPQHLRQAVSVQIGDGSDARGRGREVHARFFQDLIRGFYFGPKRRNGDVALRINDLQAVLIIESLKLHETIWYYAPALTICDGSAPTRPVISLAVACASLKSNLILGSVGIGEFGSFSFTLVTSDS